MKSVLVTPDGYPILSPPDLEEYTAFQHNMDCGAKRRYYDPAFARAVTEGAEYGWIETAWGPHLPP